ncbi:MAG: PqqD family protein [Bacteroidota bacterium]
MKINKNLAISENGFCLNPMTGESFSVNPIGAEIIQLLKQGESPEKAVKELCSIYNIDEATMEKDLYDFINVLKHHQLIQPDEKN